MPYIEHFLKSGGVYGDLGIRIKRCRDGLVIASIDPFLQTPFQVGDRILMLNGKRVTSKAEFEQKILFARVGSEFSVELFRCGKKEVLKVKIYRRKGGGYLSDTFLERKGVYVDAHLKVIRSTYAKIQKGDRLKVIDGHRVATQEDVRKWLSNVSNERFLIGLERRGLDIFIPMSKRSED